jgi:hypothetical protein
MGSVPQARSSCRWHRPGAPAFLTRASSLQTPGCITGTDFSGSARRAIPTIRSAPKAPEKHSTDSSKTLSGAKGSRTPMIGSPSRRLARRHRRARSRCLREVEGRRPRGVLRPASPTAGSAHPSHGLAARGCAARNSWLQSRAGCRTGHRTHGFHRRRPKSVVFSEEDPALDETRRRADRSSSVTDDHQKQHETDRPPHETVSLHSTE